MKKIRYISAKIPSTKNKRLKVAAYCRVSTKYEQQQSSIDLQIKHYTKFIQNNSE